MSLGRVLVTGAGGLLGGYVVRELAGRADIVGLDVLPPQDHAPVKAFHQATIEDFDAVEMAIAGCSAVVHVAARPNIWSGTGHEIIQTNVTGTWNVLQAAENAGVQRAVITSSDSVVGYTVFEGAMIPPEYLPVDNRHPLRPTDPYALSKVLCEKTGRAFLDRGKLDVVALRPVYVLYPEFECEVLARAADPDGYKGPAAGGRQPAGGGVMWHYVDPRDLARAFRLALEAERPDFGPYFICGPNTLAPDPTIERLAGRMDGVRIPVKQPEVYEASPFAPLYDLAAAQNALGFAAEHDLRQVLYKDTGI
ncbi:MAG: NAD-dependent epimerase/dehydratase family protein [Hyphomicrobiaceae bacterium]